MENDSASGVLVIAELEQRRSYLVKVSVLSIKGSLLSFVTVFFNFVPFSIDFNNAEGAGGF